MSDKWYIDKYLTALGGHVNDQLEVASVVVESQAKNNTPVDTGRLRDSIAHQVNKTEHTAIIGTPVEYAPYVEFGTGRQAEDGKGNQNIAGQKPQSFLRSALKEKEEAVRRILSEPMK
jgi:HK97 gp10 family phage protein